MPVKITYLKDRGVMVKGSGFVSWKDIYHANETIYDTADKIKSIYYQIADFTDVSGTDITSEQVKILAEQDAQAAKINPNLIVAVVGADDLVYGLARMWKAYAGEVYFETGVFRDIDTARQWITDKLDKLHGREAV